jgi:hypothetical protein
MIQAPGKGSLPLAVVASFPLSDEYFFHQQAIPFRDMVFKCPHCCMVLFANPKHPPRYLHNHVNNFHNDPETNDFSVGDGNPENFRFWG